MAPLVPFALLAGAALALAGPAAAQHEPFLVRAQEEDGHWSAARFGGQPAADLRVNAWIVLACLGDGSTMRSGPRKQQVKRGAFWLLTQQDDQGRFAMRADPEWLLDHSLATYAVAEAARLSRYKIVRPKVVAGADALAREIAVARPVVGAEVRLWAKATALSLRAIGHEETLASSARLEAALAALPCREATTPRTKAAEALLADLAGTVSADPEPADADALPASWPEDLAEDPLTTFYVAAAGYRRGGAGWKELSQRINEAVVKTQLSDPARLDLYGTWEPAGEFGAENGRLGTFAVNVLTLQIFYRYCKLSLLEQAAGPAPERTGR